MICSSSARTGSLAAAAALFTIGLFCALITGLAALVLWLAEWVGSVALAAFIVFLFFCVVALVSYLLTIRDAIERSRAQLDTVSEVAGLLKQGYDWMMHKGLFLLQFFDLSE